MKRFWTISTAAVLAAMISGSMLHWRGQQSTLSKSAYLAAIPHSGAQPFVATSELSVHQRMPFDEPLIPELLPEVKEGLPVEEELIISDAPPPQKELPRKKPEPVRSVPQKLVTTVALSNVAESTSAGSESPERQADSAAAPPGSGGDQPYLPFVLYVGLEDGKLVLQGSIPTREDTDAIYESAVKAVGEDSVVNHLKYSPDTIGASWISDLPAYIGNFFTHTGGEQELVVVDGTLKLRGAVPSENSRSGLVALAGGFVASGLVVEQELEVTAALAGSLPELPDKYPALVDIASTELEKAEPEKEIKLAMLDTAVQLSVEGEAGDRGVSGPEPDVAEVKNEKETTKEAVEAPPETEKVDYVGPAESPAEWEAARKKEKEALAAAEEAKRLKAENEAAETASRESTDPQEEGSGLVTSASGESGTPDKPVPDDGKPLIFYFETGSSEILSSDREKVIRAIQRAQRPRSIVYITAYADYRGGYELNRKLSLERAETVRSAIFSGDIADQVTAEITAKGDSQSERQDVGKRESDEALRRSRRVVVEVYHLK